MIPVRKEIKVMVENDVDGERKINFLFIFTGYTMVCLHMGTKWST